MSSGEITKVQSTAIKHAIRALNYPDVFDPFEAFDILINAFPNEAEEVAREDDPDGDGKLP